MLIRFKIFRYNPKNDQKPYFKEYVLEVYKGMTVLEALNEIKAKLDSTLSWRQSCRMGVCGSCAMIINGKPSLACQTQIMELETDEVVIEPLKSFPVIKDLACDLTNLFRHHTSIKPYIIRDDVEETINPDGEYIQSSEELENYLQFAYCIKCGACVSACPISQSNEEFLGPQALMSALRYIYDSRDNGFTERLAILDSPNGCFRCHFAQSCSYVCPKGVDPAKAIQYLKREIVLYSLGIKKKKKTAYIEKSKEKVSEIPEKYKYPEFTISRPERRL
ncbi:MAG: succinate dehydrogenase iron-sulfur subunit [candidate division WOR-3 bacterium]|nr:succinate dehydrogenase iron-sulfur subunit [candidate division WOR-3 bacterium]MDW8151211.1 succinate dehydrogenase iron-sulfur subunit [candidate division WOR-3 bacterium]